ncbi:MAG: nucleotide exchange factor GrpE [Rhodobacteraceae bacterium]|nr:nucleotide exchange factor GrpE [Paracoccaceae bacterium]
MTEPKNDDVLDDITEVEDPAKALADKSPSEEQIDDLAEYGEEDSELDVLRAERDHLKDRFMRTLADAENARKRSAKERREAEQYGGSKLAYDMLPVYDNMKRALEAAEATPDSGTALIEGVELTMRELLKVFTKHGIERIAPEIGDQFDPKLHQAMFEDPMPDTVAGEIIQVAAEGFLLHERLLRPAQVGVSSMPAEAPAD